MKPTEISDTPETDTVIEQFSHHLPNWLATDVIGGLAKRLERERNEAKKQNSKLRDIAVRAIEMSASKIRASDLRTELEQLS